MTFESLLDLYPQASLVASETDDDSFLYLFDALNIIAISRHGLSDSEITLLQAMFPKPINTSIWYQYLVMEVPINNRSLIDYQVIHFSTRIDAKNRDFWLSTLSHYFDSFEDAFFISETNGMIVIQSQVVDVESLNGFVQTIDDDFSSKTSLYIGDANPIGESHLLMVKEERELFAKLSSQMGVHQFKSSYLNGLVLPALSHSQIMASYRTKILLQQDADSLIRSLWFNHANISQTSKDLFLHRNTLNYRLDKFYEEVGLSLRDLDDLLLCYLIIL